MKKTAYLIVLTSIIFFYACTRESNPFEIHPVDEISPVIIETSEAVLSSESGIAPGSLMLDLQADLNITKELSGPLSRTSDPDGSSTVSCDRSSSGGTYGGELIPWFPEHPITIVPTISTDVSSFPTYFYVDYAATTMPYMSSIDIAYPASSPSSGLLTAGEWFDHNNWRDFQDFIQEYPQYFQDWQLDLQQRVIIEILDRSGRGVPDAGIRIKSPQGDLIYEGRTFADGRVAVFPRSDGMQEAELKIEVKFNRHTTISTMSLSECDDQLWTIKIPVCAGTSLPSLDLMFLVDVTGSMGDELRYLQAELRDITDRIFEKQINDLRIGIGFYRDRGDAFVTKIFEFSDNIDEVQGYLDGMIASGGGDYPESINLAMQEALYQMSWRDEHTVRLMFLIADAPPHFYQDEQFTYREGSALAQRKAIKIIPVAASGINKSTEFLFRHLAVRTMGRYIFITDDSGIGGSHIDPDIGDHDVEFLNGIMIRAVHEELDLWRFISPNG